MRLTDFVTNGISVRRPCDIFIPYSHFKKPSTNYTAMRHLQFGVLPDGHFSEKAFTQNGKQAHAREASSSGSTCIFPALFLCGTYADKDNTGASDAIFQIQIQAEWHG